VTGPPQVQIIPVTCPRCGTEHLAAVPDDDLAWLTDLGVEPHELAGAVSQGLAGGPPLLCRTCEVEAA
jgi:hypothetical protein